MLPCFPIACKAPYITHFCFATGYINNARTHFYIRFQFGIVPERIASKGASWPIFNAAAGFIKSVRINSCSFKIAPVRVRSNNFNLSGWPEMEPIMVSVKYSPTLWIAVSVFWVSLIVSFLDRPTFGNTPTNHYFVYLFTVL